MTLDQNLSPISNRQPECVKRFRVFHSSPSRRRRRIASIFLTCHRRRWHSVFLNHYSFLLPIQPPKKSFSAVLFIRDCMVTGISMFIHRRMKNDCFFPIHFHNLFFFHFILTLMFLHRICSRNALKLGYESTVNARHRLLPPVRRQPFRDISHSGPLYSCTPHLFSRV